MKLTKEYLMSGYLGIETVNQILKNQKDSDALDYIKGNGKLSDSLVHFINWATGSKMHGKLFTDEEFKKHWYPMLERLKILEEK